MDDHSSAFSKLYGLVPTDTGNISPFGNTQQDKLIVAGLAGVFGSGLAYFIYQRKSQAAITGNASSTSNRANSQSRQQQTSRTNTGTSQFSCIRNLPPEIRARIWQALPYEDRLNLRLTSQFTKDDVDNNVGLVGKMSTAEPVKYDFFQRVALSSCAITELPNPIDEDFLLNPSVLKCLDIREHAPIPLENLQAILRTTPNLKRLKLRLILNDDTKGISGLLLEVIPTMKSLKSLHVRTTMHHVDVMKNYIGAAASFHPYNFSTPKAMKTVHLEMPDLPEEDVARWKVILDKQICIENLTVNVGNVNWRFFEQVLRHNSATIQKLVLEGLRGWDPSRDVEDPLDWSIFTEFRILKSVDLSCNRGGERDILPTVNFQHFPCGSIEEFFVSRIVLQGEDVERVYNDMGNLQRGALDHIGTAGIERANEMAWLLHQIEEENLRWWQDERFWDLLAHGLFGVSLALVFTLVLKAKKLEGGLIDANYYNKPSLQKPYFPNQNPGVYNY